MDKVVQKFDNTSHFSILECLSIQVSEILHEKNVSKVKIDIF